MVHESDAATSLDSNNKKLMTECGPIVPLNDCLSLKDKRADSACQATTDNISLFTNQYHYPCDKKKYITCTNSNRFHIVSCPPESIFKPDFGYCM